ncbi:hypothetical protein AAMO2058_000649700 [Amorphochlora amoebiformis]
MGLCCSQDDEIEGVYNDDPEGKGMESYKIRRRIGGGTFGEVFYVRLKDSKESRALKVVKKHAPKDKGDIFAFDMVRRRKRAFLNETNILRELSRQNHPHILKHYHSFEDSKGFYIVTELCRGVSLFDRITACGSVKLGTYPFTERSAARITKHMLEAIRFCHSKGVVHRDIKPENFLFKNTSATSPLKLIDFGEAVRLISEDQRIFNVAGSEYYLAPEVLPTNTSSFRRTLREWKAADLWSVGVVLYVCLFGRPPFVGSDALSTFSRIKKGEVAWVSENALDFLRRILKTSEARISMSDAMKHPFLTSGDAKDDPIPSTILQALTKFKKHCKLKRVVGRVLADKMKDNDKRTLQKIFRDFDKNGDGFLDKSELTTLMRSIQTLDEARVHQFKKKKYVYGMTEAEEMLKAREVVRKDSKVITEEDFITMYAAHHVGRLDSKEDLRVAFDSLDLDNDGFVTAEDLHTSCGFMTPKTCAAITRESADDKERGKISFQAFIKAMRNTPSYSNPPTPRMRSLHESTRTWSNGGTPIQNPASPLTPPVLTGIQSSQGPLTSFQAPQIGGKAANSTSKKSMGILESMKQPLLSKEVLAVN